MFDTKVMSVVAGLFLIAMPLFGAGEREAELEFFQHKMEAEDTFDELLEEFMEEYEELGIQVEQNQAPEADTQIMSRLASDRLPEIISINADATYGELADSGELKAWDGTEIAERIHEAHIEMTQMLAEERTDRIYGIPYAANANTVLYNVDMFEELGLDIPTTWSEFIEVAETIEDAGEQPFFHTFADEWTVMVPWNSLAANYEPADFPQLRREGEATFSEYYEEPAEKMLTLLEYGGDDPFGYSYSDGNHALARGDTAMLIQGVWAISDVEAADPDHDIGVFAMPVRENPEENLLVSGVDSIISIPEGLDEETEEAAVQVVEYLTRQDVAHQYIHGEGMFPTVKGIDQEDPMMEELQPYFAEGRLTHFPDHYYPPDMGFAGMVVEFLQHGDVDQFLQDIDDTYDLVRER